MYTKENLVGQTYNLLTVTNPAGKSEGKRLWECKCTCGGKTITSTANLRAERVRSCGCLRSPGREKSPHWSGCGEITGSMFYRICREAKRRKIPVNITIEDCWAQYQSQQGKCAISGIQLSLPKNNEEEKNYTFTASLDRKNSTLPYTKTNIQWTHKVINRMKWDLTQEDLLYWCKLITEASSQAILLTKLTN